MAEKKQLAGLKDIGNYPGEIAAMIRRLLDRGYDRVYITADHGFVLTGILDDADKVAAPKGDFKVKLKADGNPGGLFDSLKVKVMLYEGREQKSVVIQTMKAGEEKQLEFEINQDEGKIIVVNATTSRQLDHCDLKKSSSRDLGGLL